MSILTRTDEDMETDIHIGKRIRRRRRLLGLTQQALADAVGVRFQQIQKYECGANRVSANRLLHIASALEVPIAYFYDGLPVADKLPHAGLELTGSTHDPQIEEAMAVLVKLNPDVRRRMIELMKSTINAVPVPTPGKATA